MPGTAPKALGVQTHLTLMEIYEVGTVTIILCLGGRLRHREGKQFIQGPTTRTFPVFKLSRIGSRIYRLYHYSRLSLYERLIFFLMRFIQFYE